MISFKQRSSKKELLDRDDIPFDDIRRNMQELNVINQRLGGHAITISGLKAVIQKQLYFNHTLHVMEIGCGGGDNLRAIRKWALHMKLPVQLTGVDINGECVEFARQQHKGISFIQADYRDAQPEQPADIIFSSLFCHHFSNEELVFMLQWMRSNSRMGFFINDLHRHPLAYYSIRLLTRLFSRSYLVKNDAPLSVQRGFTKKEWVTLLQAAGITHYRISWRWAFRWLIVYHADAE